MLPAHAPGHRHVHGRGRRAARRRAGGGRAMSSASTSQDRPRTYRGLNNREQTGWVLGVTPMQAFVCVVLAAPVLIALAAGDYRQALVWLGDQRAAGRRWSWSRCAAGPRCAGSVTCCCSRSGC